jgi:hypothetical protein
MTRTTQTGRTYNQLHVPRTYTPGRRRVSVYWTWSYPWEANQDVTVLDNRLSTMTEVRRVAWPAYETLEYSAKMFQQGIAGTLELFHLSLVRFQELAGAITGHPVAVYQRVDQAGQRRRCGSSRGARGAASCSGRTTTSAPRPISRCAPWSTPITAIRSSPPSSASRSTCAHS